jgi:hypothetical protein
MIMIPHSDSLVGSAPRRPMGQKESGSAAIDSVEKLAEVGLAQASKHRFSTDRRELHVNNLISIEIRSSHSLHVKLVEGTIGGVMLLEGFSVKGVG